MILTLCRKESTHERESVGITRNILLASCLQAGPGMSYFLGEARKLSGDDSKWLRSETGIVLSGLDLIK